MYMENMSEHSLKCLFVCLTEEKKQSACLKKTWQIRHDIYSGGEIFLQYKSDIHSGEDAADLLCVL